MGIDDGFFIKEDGVGTKKVPQGEDRTYCTHCLLCGKLVVICFPFETPKVCDDCKKLWKRFKEAQK